jgi:hypothetical protein
MIGLIKDMNTTFKNNLDETTEIQGEIKNQ